MRRDPRHASHEPPGDPGSERRPGRLKRVNRRLRDTIRTYRIGLSVLAAAVVILAFVLSYALLEDDTETVLLGRGKAGVMLPDTVESVADLPGGEASYYGEEFAGRPTASGEIFDPERLTAAHRTLPLGSRVRVTNLRNGESVVVRINDRGPFAGQRVIDLSLAAARELDMLEAGTAPVRIELLG